MSQSPTDTTSTEMPWASSISAATPRRALATELSSVASPAKSHERRSRSWARARRATVAASPGFFWIRARVCSTESWRWAATSARSWVRTRSDRSAVRSVASRKTQGPTTIAMPTTPSAAASRAVLAVFSDPSSKPTMKIAENSRPTPAATRAYAAQPPPPKISRAVLTRPVLSSQRSR